MKPLALLVVSLTLNCQSTKQKVCFEGYVLTGRHGFFASYESFLRVVDSMITQHFKWLRKSKTHTTWRKNYPALNLIATSTVFQQDHNGYTHQDPGILTHLAEKT